MVSKDFIFSTLQLHPIHLVLNLPFVCMLEHLWCCTLDQRWHIINDVIEDAGASTVCTRPDHLQTSLMDIPIHSNENYSCTKDFHMDITTQTMCICNVILCASVCYHEMRVIQKADRTSTHPAHIHTRRTGLSMVVMLVNKWRVHHGNCSSWCCTNISCNVCYTISLLCWQGSLCHTLIHIGEFAIM